MSNSTRVDSFRTAKSHNYVEHPIMRGIRTYANVVEPFRAVTLPYTATHDDFFLFNNNVGTLTLPTDGQPGQRIRIFVAAGPMTLAASAGETINGLASITVIDDFHIEVTRLTTTTWAVTQGQSGTSSPPSPLLIGNGLVGTPSLAFADDQDTGIYSPVDGILAITSDGTETVRFVSSQTMHADGVAGAPAMTFGSDTNLGLFRAGADSLGVIANAAVSFGNSAGITSMSWDNTNGQWAGVSGNAARPVYSFVLGTDTGMYLTAGAETAFSHNGTQVVRVDDAGFSFPAATATLSWDAVATVTQLTNNNTGVTANGAIGRITMQAAIATGASHTFVVSNTSVDTNSTILLSVNSDSAGNDPCIANFNTIVDATSFAINVQNTDAAAATAAPPVVHFLILNPN